jgi:hypothetical protein
LRRADPSSKEWYCLCKKGYETEDEARAEQRAVEPLMNDVSDETKILFRFFLLQIEGDILGIK